MESKIIAALFYIIADYSLKLGITPEQFLIGLQNKSSKIKDQEPKVREWLEKWNELMLRELSDD